MPVFEFPRAQPPAVIDVVVGLGFAASRGEAKRLIEQGGLKLNDKPVTSVTATIGTQDLDAEGAALISAGKKRRGMAKAV